jgi:hypothetical protein
MKQTMIKGQNETTSSKQNLNKKVQEIEPKKT